MRDQLGGSVAGRMVLTSAALCAAAAVVALVAFSATGRPLAGAALAVGLLLGAANGVVAARLIQVPIPFFASSLLRLATLSMIGIAIGLALGISNIWLVILGVGAAQFVLAATAVRAAAQR